MRQGVRHSVRMTGVAVALGWAALIAISAVDPAYAQGFGSATPERFFRVEAEGGQGRGGRPVVRGYIYNNYGQAAGRILLRVETLDAGGQVVASSLVHVDSTVPQFDRVYFEGPVSAGGSSYRVSVYYYEWLGRGGGGVSLPIEDRAG
jgi:hypothetical protein